MAPDIDAVLNGTGVVLHVWRWRSTTFAQRSKFVAGAASRFSSNRSKRAYAGWHGLRIRTATGFACIRVRTGRRAKGYALPDAGTGAGVLLLKFLKWS